MIFGLGEGFGTVKSDAGHFGEILKSSFKIDMIEFLDKSKNIPGFAATETFEDLQLGGNDKRRGFSTMKRTIGQIMAAAFFQG